MKKALRKYRKAFLLAHKDSNLERQNQNLLCYHYTMGQNHVLFLKAAAKI